MSDDGRVTAVSIGAVYHVRHEVGCHEQTSARIAWTADAIGPENVAKMVLECERCDVVIVNVTPWVDQ